MWGTTTQIFRGKNDKCERHSLLPGRERGLLRRTFFQKTHPSGFWAFATKGQGACMLVQNECEFVLLPRPLFWQSVKLPLAFKDLPLFRIDGSLATGFLIGSWSTGLFSHYEELGTANQSIDLIVKVDLDSWSDSTSYRSTSSRPVAQSAYMNLPGYGTEDGNFISVSLPIRKSGEGLIDFSDVTALPSEFRKIIGSLRGPFPDFRVWNGVWFSCLTRLE